MEPWLSGSWILEYVGEGEDGIDGVNGLVVRRSWCSVPNPEDGSEPVSWDGSTKVEQLLVSCDLLAKPGLISWKT